MSKFERWKMFGMKATCLPVTWQCKTGSGLIIYLIFFYSQYDECTAHLQGKNILEYPRVNTQRLATRRYIFEPTFSNQGKQQPFGRFIFLSVYKMYLHRNFIKHIFSETPSHFTHAWRRDAIPFLPCTAGRRSLSREVNQGRGRFPWVDTLSDVNRAWELGLWEIMQIDNDR